MKKIPLKGKYGAGKFTLVDDDIFDMYKDMYVYLTNRNKVMIYENKKNKLGKHYQIKSQLHRLVMGANKHQEVDHINRDTLDNRRTNLRLCTRSQNMQNVGVYSNNRSGLKGVHWNGKMKLYYVHICPNRKTIKIGKFKDKFEAAEAYNKAAIKYFGEFASLNILRSEQEAKRKELLGD